jgi:membrane protein
MFKWLPDAKIRWRDVGVGAACTAAMFLVGKFLLGIYLGTQDPSAYGPAASLVLILVWVYYSAMILLLGAEFTRVWAEESKGKHFRPEEGAIHLEGAHAH